MNLTGLPPQGVNFSKASTASRQPSVQPGLLFGSKLSDFKDDFKQNQAEAGQKQAERAKQLKIEAFKIIGDEILFTKNETTITMADVLVDLYESGLKTLEEIVKDTPLETEIEDHDLKIRLNALLEKSYIIVNTTRTHQYGLTDEGFEMLQEAYPKENLAEKGHIYNKGNLNQ